MKINVFNLCFLCALFLLSVVATETLKEETLKVGKQYTKESKKNVLVDKFDGGRKPIDIESFDQNKSVGAGNKTREERMMEKEAKQKEIVLVKEAKQKERALAKEAKLNERPLAKENKMKEKNKEKGYGSGRRSMHY
uniref:Uncharacterized protein LOC105851658 n=1 Tax=Cicer arietinum TaxID=3827 RepID=A0A1S3DYH5_CICAR|nr:uncharacterized protein LOC105851658 [Cicer arietinum]